MSFIDKIVNSVKLNDSYDDQEEFLDDEDFEEEEEPRRSFAERWREKREAKKERKHAERASRKRNDEEEEEDASGDERTTYSFVEESGEPEEETGHETYQKRKSRWMRRSKERRSREEDDRYAAGADSYESEESAYSKAYESPARPKVTPMRQRKAGQVPMEVKVIRPTSMEDSREIADTLISECTVLLNLEGIDMDIAQRIIDFTCGTCYSLKGRLQKISNYIFILTPEEVDISGDVISMLGGNFDIPTMRSEYYS